MTKTRRSSNSPGRVQTQLSEQDQSAYLELLLRGASPAAAAGQLGIDLFVIVEAIADDEPFRIKVDAVQDALAQNVAARLYQEAMKGSVSAMTFWLKNRPPPEWPGDAEPTSQHLTGLDLLSDDELLRLARLENIAIPPELEASLANSGSPEPSAAVSSTGATQ